MIALCIYSKFCGKERGNMNKAKYRHELKYHINFSDYLTLKARLKHVMQKDGNVSEHGKYLIRSVYFDNYRDKALKEKIDGVGKREKFRIRYYNDDFSYIVLEKKMKVNNLCMKLDAVITEKECRRLMEGDTGWMLGHSEELVKELYVKMKTEQLCPRVLVSYIREPYIYKAGNVRITFDSNIRSTLFHGRFLEEGFTDMDVSDRAGDMILEIKYDEYLPEIIAHMVQLGDCRQEAFSKYGICRRFG